MNPLDAAVAIAAGVTSLGLAAAGWRARGPRGRRGAFALGALGLAAQSAAAFHLINVTQAPDERLLWLRIVESVSIGLVAPWMAFVVSLLGEAGGAAPRIWRWSSGIVALVGAGAVAATWAWPPFLVADVEGPFYAARLTPEGRYVVVAQLLCVVAILAALETALRTSSGAARWRIKYLVLGVAGAFLVRFYFLSHMLLFHVVLGAYLSIQAVAVTVGNIVVGISLLRDSVASVHLTVSRHLLYRSVIVAVLGVYLFVVGALGWLLNELGVAEELFWGSVVVFVSALVLAALLLSEDLRWRLKRFIALHFYRSKYDYRQQWSGFTRRLGSRVTVDEIVPELLTAVTEAVGTTQAALYLTPAQGGGLELAGAVGADRPAPTLALDGALGERLTTEGGPVALDDGPAVAVPLRWGGQLAGVMLVGPERAGAAYTHEDLDFLATVGEQAAGVILTARLSEALAQSREFEAFSRLTSFVVHDLKNSIAALSMLSQNALAHFDDPEFQRDAIKTLSRTVERMTRLLARLSAPAPERASLRSASVDVAALAREATQPLAGHVRLKRELEPVPAVSGDQEALLRVFENLVTNAVEAIDGGGDLIVRTYRDRQFVVFSVADTGPGMSEEFMRTSLFTPFRSTKKGGWGIGLYQARAIVEAHGGSIEVASREGEGSTFSVKLPIEAR